MTGCRDSVVFECLNLWHKGLTKTGLTAMSIKQRRIKKEWSQEQLAQLSGLSTRTIQRIEAGHSAGLESLKSLAAVFETSVSALMKEQTMTDQQKAVQHSRTLINSIEREAIEFAQSLINGPKKEHSDPLNKIEREAITYARNLLRKFRT